MTKRKAMVGGAVVAAVILIGTAATWAVGQPGTDPQGQACRPLAKLIRGEFARTMVLREQLDLSAEQRGELHTIFAAHKGELKRLVVEMVSRKRALRDVVTAEPADEAAIREEAAALGETIGDFAVAMSGVLAEARTVLTREQLDLIEQSMADREAAVDRWLGQAGG